MKKFRALACTLTLSCTAALGTTLAAPAAQADVLGNIVSLGILDSVVSTTISSADCSTVKTVLTAIDAATPGVLLDATTTRSQLATNLRNLSGQNLSAAGALALPAIKYSGETANKALQCGLVKKDPETGFGNGLSSQITEFMPLLAALSSKN